MVETYDVVVIGSGPGGYVAANRAAQHGLRVAVVERERLGGVCLNWGCIPTKALLRSATLYEELDTLSAYGLRGGKRGYDAKAVVARAQAVAERMHRGVAGLFRKYKVHHISGTARLVGPEQVAWRSADGAEGMLHARSVILATGVRARRPAIFQGAAPVVMDYREALGCTRLPRSLLVVGAGAIGVEFAYYFSAFGVRVDVVEQQTQLLPSEDAEIARQLLSSFTQRGIRCHVATQVTKFQARKDGVEAVLSPAEGEPVRLRCDAALIAVGMEANREGLEYPGIEWAQGFVRTDAQMRTGIASVYAIGDLAGRQLLAHKASAEAEAAVAAICGEAHPPLDYAQIPSCTYCQPQVASVGLSEAACRKQGLPFRVGRFPFLASGKAHAMGEAQGMIKLLFGEPHGQLLGAHMIGSEVTELLAGLGLALRLEATADEILATVHAHPTLSEGVFEATAAALGKSANL